MTAPTLDIRLYVTEWGDVRIETPHWRLTLPPAEFVQWLQSARPNRGRSSKPSLLPSRSWRRSAERSLAHVQAL